MVKIFKGVLSESDVNLLLDYNSVVDNRSDIRPDVTSKHPRWDVDNWPQYIIKQALDTILDYDYLVEEVIFNTSRISFRLHTDSGDGSSESLNGTVIVIPLKTNGPSFTAFFDNYKIGPSTRFSRKIIPPFEYRLKDKNNNWYYTEDLRKFLNQCIESPELLPEFNVNQELINQIKYLIDARSNKKIAQVDRRCYDYSDVINFRPNEKFDAELHKKYLYHMDIDDLHGLTLSDIAEWHKGDCIVFPRTQLHSAGAGHTEKIGITIFTQRKD